MKKNQNFRRFLAATRSSFFRTKAAVVFSTFGVVGPLTATDITWSGASGTTFSDVLNWGGTAPADDLISDRGVFSGTPTANLPQLTASRLINGLYFSGTTTGGWILGSNSTSNVLSLGANGVDSRNTSGTNTISANLNIGAAQLWNQSTGGTLKATGTISMGTSGAPAAYTWTLGGAGSGTIVLEPGTGNSVNVYSTSTTAALQVSKSLTLGSAVNSTASTNIISTNGAGAGIALAGGQTLTVNSGTWLTNDLGRNSGAAFAGTVNFNGGTIASGGGRYLANINGSVGAVWNVNGGTLKITGGGNTVSNSGSFQLGGSVTGTPVSSDAIKFNLQNGFVDVAKTTGTISTIGSVVLGVNVPQVLMNQSGGIAQFGVTTGYNVFTNATNANAGTGLTIGVVSSASGANKAAYTLSDGRLLIAGTLAGNAPGATTAGGVSNFNFMGGTLTVGTYAATNLGSSATATSTANQTAVSSSIGTLVNYGGILAPGGDLVTNTPDAYGNASLSYIPTSGKTAITGNYQVNSGSLAVNIGGTTASTAFQDATNSGKFGNVSVSGTTVLGGTLTANLVNGAGGTTFIPAGGNTFQIISSTGALSGTFTNAGNKVVLGNDPFSGSLNIVYTTGAGGNVTLGGYTANEWQGGGNWGTGGTARWTNAVDPNAASSGAKFGAAGTGATVVTLDANRSVGQLLFSSANYTISGSSTLTLDNGASAASITLQDATTQTISAPIVLNSSLTVTGFSGGTTILGNLAGAARNLTANTSGSTLTLTGTNTYNNTSIASGVTLNVGNGGSSGNLGSGTVTNSGNLFFNRTDTALSVGAAINGAGNLTQSGTGTTTLTGTNGYTGTTAISAGTLKLAGSGTLGATTSTLGVIAGGAVLDLNGTNQTVAGFSGTSAGQIRNDSGGGTSVLTIGGGSANTFAGVLADNNTVATGGKLGLALGGTGAVSLSGANTYSGGTSVGGTSTLKIAGTSSQTSLVINSSPTGKGNVTFGNGASLDNSATGNSWFVPKITLEGTLNLVGGNRLAIAYQTIELGGASRTVNVNSKSLAVTSGNTLASETTGNWSWETATTLGTPVVQNGTLNLQTTAFSGSNYGGYFIRSTTFTNADLVIGNNVILGANGTSALGTNASTSPNVTINGAGILNMLGTDKNVKSLAGSGSINNSMLASNLAVSTLTINGTTGSTDFSGVISNGPGTGALSVTKTGGSTQTLSGANNYTGTTTVKAGALLIGTTGSLANTAVTVGGTGTTGTPTLGGGGTIGGATSFAEAGGGVAGTHAPGVTGVNNGVGVQTFSSTLDYGSGSIFEWSLQAASTADPGAVADASTGIYDKVVANGAAGSVTGNGAVFKIVLGGNAFTDAFWNSDKTWTNIFSGIGAASNLASIFTTFGGANVNTDGTVTGNSGHFTFNGSSTLTWSAVPEPTSALAGMLVIAGLLRRRRA